jgi:uncharacterized protein YjbJ (UPF0337 family)
MVNQQELQGNWNQIKGALKEKWGKLTNDDLREFDGNVDELVGIIQRKTGAAREAIERFLEQITSEGSSTLRGAASTAREYAHQASGAIRDTYDQVAGNVRGGFAGAERVVQRNPSISVGVAFGAGLVAGVIVGLVMRSR